MTIINVGDKVLCGPYSGDEVKVGDEEFKIVGIDYILAIVN
jgi:co-chaperonin GroES (HSP10)